jgi:hypothetical protein
MTAKSTRRCRASARIPRRHIGGLALVLAVAVACGAPALAAPKVPPTIDELDGSVWAVKISGTEYDLDVPAKLKFKVTETWAFTVVDASTLSIESDGPGVPVYAGNYVNGMLVIGELDDDILSTQTRYSYAIISGTPGKLKLKGESLKYELLSDNTLEAVKLSGKQLQ